MNAACKNSAVKGQAFYPVKCCGRGGLGGTAGNLAELPLWINAKQGIKISMDKSGVFAVSRGVFDHPLFAHEPFTEREAWVWLIGEAAWRPRRVRVRNGTIDLKRGQLAHATRFLASKWQWSEARVRRFLTRLKTDAMIDAQSDAHATLITICKYDEYQKVALPSDAQNDADDDAQSTRTRRKEENIQSIEEDSVGRASEPMARLEFTHTFWPNYPNPKAFPVALASFIAARRKVSLETIMEGVRRYARDKPEGHHWMKPSTFLDEERWKDEPTPASQPAAKERPHDAIFRALARHAQAGSGDDERPADAPLRVLDQRGPAAGTGLGDSAVSRPPRAGFG